MTEGNGPRYPIGQGDSGRPEETAVDRLLGGPVSPQNRPPREENPSDTGSDAPTEPLTGIPTSDVPPTTSLTVVSEDTPSSGVGRPRRRRPLGSMVDRLKSSRQYRRARRAQEVIRDPGHTARQTIETYHPVLEAWGDRAVFVGRVVSHPVETAIESKKPWSPEQIDHWDDRRKRLELLHGVDHKFPLARRALYGAAHLTAGTALVATDLLYGKDIPPWLIVGAYGGTGVTSGILSIVERGQKDIKNTFKGTKEGITALSQTSRATLGVAAIEGTSMFAGHPIPAVAIGAGHLAYGAYLEGSAVVEGVVRKELRHANNTLRRKKQLKMARERQEQFDLSGVEPLSPVLSAKKERLLWVKDRVVKENYQAAKARVTYLKDVITRNPDREKRQRTTYWTDERIKLWEARTEELRVLSQIEHANSNARRTIYGILNTGIGGGMIATEQIADKTLDPRLIAGTFAVGATASLVFSIVEHFQRTFVDIRHGTASTMSATRQVGMYGLGVAAAEMLTDFAGMPMSGTVLGAGLIAEGGKQGISARRERKIKGELKRHENKLRRVKSRRREIPEGGAVV